MITLLAAACVVSLRGADPAHAATTLYDQFNATGGAAIGAQDFETSNDAFDNVLADDFVVPAGGWTLSEMDLRGGTFNGAVQPASFNVFFYNNSGTLPGSAVWSLTGVSFTRSNISGPDADYALNLGSVPLAQGTYWVGVQARLDFTGGGQWGWYDRTITSNNPAAWKNPGGGYGITACTSFKPRAATCNIDPTPPDQVFRLIGTVGAGAATTTAVSGSPNPSMFGQTVTLASQVCANTGTTAPTGSVAFSEGSTNFGSAPLSGDTVPTSGPCTGLHTANASKTLSGSQLTPGAHTITATYTPDSPAFIGSSGNYGQTVGCSQTVTGSTGNVSASSGATCIQNANVGGSVTVGSGASLFVTNSTIAGTLTSNGANTLRVCGSTVKGTTSIARSSGFVLLGSDSSTCPADSFAALTLNGNNNGLRVGGNTMSGNVQVTGNTATGIDPLTQTSSANAIRHNTIRGSLGCSGNTPPATNEGVSNSVSGGRSGECASPTF